MREFDVFLFAINNRWFDVFLLHKKQIGAWAADAMFKADGTPIRDPVAYAARLRRGQYRGDLVDALGNAIEDPTAFAAKLAPKEEPEDAPPSTRSSANSLSGEKPEMFRADSNPTQSAGDNAEIKMFKADGTPIRDPIAYVSRLGQFDYKMDLVDEDGRVIEDPVALVRHLASDAPTEKMTRRGVSRSGGVFKADGTEVRDPAAYVAAMERTGGYTGGLFNSAGQEIQDAAAYVSRMVDSGSPRAPAVANGSWDALYTADGTKVRDAEAYVRGMERKGVQYQGGLFNAKGEEIRDPFAYVSRMASGVEQRRAVARGWESAGRDRGKLYKADGTLVRDPAAYVAGIERKLGGYQGGLFNHKGEEIRDPGAYVRGMRSSPY